MSCRYVSLQREYSSKRVFLKESIPQRECYLLKEGNLVVSQVLGVSSEAVQQCNTDEGTLGERKDL